VNQHRPLLFAFLLLGACQQAVDPPAPAPSAALEPPPVPLSPPVPLRRVSEVREGGSLVLARLGTRNVALVADEESSSVHLVDLDRKEGLGALGFRGRPGQLLLTGDGRVAVSLRDEARVAFLEAHDDGSLAVVGRIDTAQEPIALALTPDDASLVVACGWSHTVEGFRLATKERFLSKDVGREPRAVLVTGDGQRALVAHGAAGLFETIDLEAKKSHAIDLGFASTLRFGGWMMMMPMAPRRAAFDDPFDDDLPKAKHARKPEPDPMPRRFSRQGFALARFQAKSEERILLPHTEVVTGDPTELSSGYGGGGLAFAGFADLPSQSFQLSVLDASDGKRTRSVNPAGTGKDACNLPRAVAVDGDEAWVACLGSDRVMKFPLRGGAPTGLVTARLDVPSGPTGLAIDPEQRRLVVYSAFDGALTTISTHADAPMAQVLLVRSSGLTDLQREGRKLFHDAGNPRIAKDGRTCASCHVDGRDDGLVWSTPNGPRQTILLAGREARSAPFGWLGKHESLPLHMTTTMKNLKGTGVTEHELEALAAYVTSLKGAPKEVRALTDEESRGRDVFTSSDAMCSSCHTEKSGFTDHDVHDVHSATPTDVSGKFLVPSLVGVAGSAPYFHDGRYDTLEALLAGSDGTMGSTKELSSADKRALVAYLRTL
jgi:mono/diheme cytochrome c family protein